ncbi:MAG: glycosyltransferase, partial [Bacteroidota bacterium]
PDGTAFLCNSFEPEAFAQKLAQLVTDDALRTRMAEGGWEHVRQRFHYTRLVANMAELYERLLAEKSR